LHPSPIRPREILILALAVAFPWFLAAPRKINLNRSDSTSYYAYVRSPVVDGDLHFKNDFQQSRRRYFANPRTATGLYYNPHSPGPGMVWAPFFLAAHAATALTNGITGEEKYSRQGWESIYLRFVGWGDSLCLFGGFLLSYYWMRRYFRPPKLPVGSFGLGFFAAGDRVPGGNAPDVSSDLLLLRKRVAAGLEPAPGKARGRPFPAVWVDGRYRLPDPKPKRCADDVPPVYPWKPGVLQARFRGVFMETVGRLGGGGWRPALGLVSFPPSCYARFFTTPGLFHRSNLVPSTVTFSLPSRSFCGRCSLSLTISTA